MSTEPQVARVVQQPEPAGSSSQHSPNSHDGLAGKALTNHVSASHAGRTTSSIDKPREDGPSGYTAASAPAQSMTGRPAFPNQRDLFLAPDRREPVRDLRVEARAEPAVVEADVPAVAPAEASPSIDVQPEPVASGERTGEEPAVSAADAGVAAAMAAEAPAPAEAPVATESANAPAVEVPAEPGAPMPGIPIEPSSGLEALAAAEMEDLGYDDIPSEYDEAAVRAGDLCQGQIVSIDGDNVIVDYGGKTEGVVPLAELREGGIAEPAPGQSIEVSVESLGAPGDYAVLSFLKAHRSRIWEDIEKAYRQKELLTAKVTERVKGGLTVDIGIPAFLPGSQADVRPVPDLDSLVGQEIPVRIVKLSRSRGNVVVSRRALLEEELHQRRQETLAGLSEGATVSGTVKNVTNYGAFIDLGGIDGLLHITDISWGRVRNPAEVLRVGQEISLKVLKFDAGKERVSLSLKHMEPDPWENIEQRYREGERSTGRVISITDYGAFVELESGLEGLIHVSELSWSKRLKHPSKVLKLEQQVEGVITQINTAERRISLSLKRLQPDPWINLSERYPVGQIVQGRVRNLTSYGAFVEIEEGVDGLVHVSDLSWSKQVKHPKDVLKKGQTIRAVVLHVDTENRRVSLGVKQLEPDVWEKFFSLHLVGDDVKGQVTRLAKFGAFVELAPGVEGLCHNSEMSAQSSKQRKPALRAGQEYEFRIIKLDEFDKKISLSRRAYELAHGPAASNGSVSAASVENPTDVVHDLTEETA